VEGQAFALIFPDDLIVAQTPCIGQMIESYETGSMIAVQEVSPADIPQYGIVDPVSSANPSPLRGVVEKPRVEDAPSRLGIVGRYILGPTIFEHIDATPPGKNGERQITDALARQIGAGELVTAFCYEGTRHDTGRPLGYLGANVALALGHETLGPALRRRLHELNAMKVD
jgi:UTP--glucose-1-phosphate uridylyltransferase